VIVLVSVLRRILRCSLLIRPPVYWSRNYFAILELISPGQRADGRDLSPRCGSGRTGQISRNWDSGAFAYPAVGAYDFALGRR
jgi:hypothetical protein